VKPANDHVIVPFTERIVGASTAVLTAFGEPAASAAPGSRRPPSPVDVKNGCNGVEAMLILFAAVLAFPAPWRAGSRPSSPARWPSRR